MSLTKFGPSTPDDHLAMLAYKRVREFLERERLGAAEPKTFNTNRLFDVVGGLPSFALASALANVVSEGLVKLVVRVEPKFGEGIGDFDSFEDVPDEVEDWRNGGAALRVLPEHLQIYYRLFPTADT